jgi:hypothetical protein
MVTNGARRGPTREIKHRVATAKDSTRRRQIGLKFKAAWFCVVLKLGHCGKEVSCTWKVLKCVAGER